MTQTFQKFSNAPEAGCWLPNRMVKRMQLLGWGSNSKVASDDDAGLFLSKPDPNGRATFLNNL